MVAKICSRLVSDDLGQLAEKVDWTLVVSDELLGQSFATGHSQHYVVVGDDAVQDFAESPTNE